MYVLADKKIPPRAKDALSREFEILEIETEGITYPAVSGHPDIFFCSLPDRLIAAPNLPDPLKKFLEEKKINYLPGKTGVGIKYPGSARYNCAATGSLLVHRLDITDPVILEAAPEAEKINVKQGYTRCNLIPLRNFFLTCDGGIYRTLDKKGLAVEYVKPGEIILPGFLSGFIGGTCGITDDKIFFIGSLNYHSMGSEIRELLKKAGYRTVELYDGPLFDGGSLIFVK